MGVCTSPSLGLRDGLAGPTFIKRVIGLPGDTVWSPDGHIWVQGRGQADVQLDEPYVNDHQETLDVRSSGWIRSPRATTS